MKNVEEHEKVNMQSNGSLMRCSSLALIPDYKDSMYAMKTDVYLTNPNRINMEIEFFYVSFLRAILRGDSDVITKCIDLYQEIG